MVAEYVILRVYYFTSLRRSSANWVRRSDNTDVILPNMKLESQLTFFADLDIVLNDGVTVDDLLAMWPRERYEQEPFDHLLCTFGFELYPNRDPWEFSSSVLLFDCECISDESSYQELISDICELAGTPDAVQDFEGEIDLAKDSGWLRCTVNGKPKSWDVVVGGDWVDDRMVFAFMVMLDTDDRQFYYRSDGQGMTLIYTAPEICERLNAVLTSPLSPVSSVPAE